MIIPRQSRPRRTKEVKLNLGCGSTKLEGYVNIDVEKTCKPDKVVDFIAEQLKYTNNSISEIVLFHTIEHIQKRFHKRILAECWRVLKPGGRIIISYPEFIKCADNWKKNYRGKREFWEATIFGRQLYPSDFHITLMCTTDFLEVLRDCGFVDFIHKSETLEPYNTVVTSIKGDQPIDYEELIKDYISHVKFTYSKHKLKAA